jgi:hypothetical protein
MSQNTEIVDRDSGIAIVKGPMIAIPRKGEKVRLHDTKYTVDEIVFDFQNVKRIGVKEKAELMIRVFVKRD